ncbi:hypothetical protein [uncultured Brachyspira sp.]|uniref:hypothetical protein n=1 Tax=uncultured Brachyspira sp. TaxID=221953 RepID=UPI0025FE161C|nr:hypothetical protein [uncultured Brachyspira sp.]
MQITYKDIENIKYIDKNINYIDFLGIIYEKAIEAKAKIDGLPNLHILIGKSSNDNLYRALCLDSGIICISKSSKLDEDTINYLFDESCILALNQFYRAVKNDEENIFSGYVYNKAYWDIYNYFILKTKNNILSRVLKILKVSEGKTNIENIPYNKIDMKSLMNGNNSIFYLLSILEQILLNNNEEERHEYLEELYKKVA